VYPLSGSSEQNESGAPEPAYPTYGSAATVLSWVAGAAIGVYIFKKMLGDGTSLELQVLHGTTRLLQFTARTAGRWALMSESAYNDLVGTIH
jgi:hypothetical protein